MSEKKEDILGMDFGDLMDYSTSTDVQVKPKSKPKEEGEEELEEEQVSVNDTLEAELSSPGDDDEEEKETPGEDDKGDDDDEVEDVEDVKDVDDKDTDPDSSKRTKKSSSDPFALAYAKFLLESGSISSLDEEAFKDIIDSEGEASALQYLIQGELDQVKNDLVSELKGYQKEYTELRELGVDPETASSAIAAIEDVDKINDEAVENEDNEELRKNILTAFYKETTQFSDDRIKKLVNRSVELGDDVSEAKEALEGLKQARKDYAGRLKEEQEQALEKQKKQHQDTLKELRKKIEDVKEIIPGQKINKQTRDKIDNLLTKPVKQLENGQVLNGVWSKRAEDPLDFDVKLAALVLMGAFDGKFGNLKTKVKTDAATELEERIKREPGYYGSGRTPRKPGSKDSKDMVDKMKEFFS